ncbi:MAG TPA: hypothetical protein VMM79_05035 [Longimicrobiales bacterium]|nr:hypothetical protein [Longimicrobiales bacterium]
MIARLTLSAFVLLAVIATGAAAQQPPFPHDMHAGLFPVCTLCHTMDGPTDDWYPSPTTCAGCHDGAVVDRVEWVAPEPQATLLDFSHTQHDRVAANDAISCEGCHVDAGRDRMTIVDRAVVEQCLSCHGHQSPQHLSGAQCSTCHIPLAESRFDLGRVLALPLPPGHGAPDFLANHEGNAECGVCHTRERCTACHVNAATLADVQALPVAGAGLELPRWTASYFTPPSHQTGEWLWQHGAEAATPASCSSCHTRDTCASCHIDSPPVEVAALPAASHVQAQGVSVRRAAPESHASPVFGTSHAWLAETSPRSCSACHGRTECAACHDAAANAGFHPPQFLESHPTEAFARRLECANCHDAEVFCQACHRTAGRAPTGVTGAVYHDAESAWLLRHGQAARQGLESCASCHRPPDCLRCHSQLGAFRVSPHGPMFDAEQASRRNAFVCRTCHIRDPLGGTGG